MTSCQDPSNSPSLVHGAIAELIALGAAMAANCEESFQLHHYRLHKLGVSKEDMIAAVNIALRVKMAPHRNLVDMAEHYLVGGAAPESAEDMKEFEAMEEMESGCSGHCGDGCSGCGA